MVDEISVLQNSGIGKLIPSPSTKPIVGCRYFFFYQSLFWWYY